MRLSFPPKDCEMDLFFTFEGIEGSGKTTQMEMVYHFLCSQAYRVKMTREPGGTFLGEQIREILLSHRNRDMVAPAELLLYQASRAQGVHEVIRPALKEGIAVLCDRFTDATLAYQGYGRGLDLDLIRRLNDVATGGLYPALTFLLDCPVDIGFRRIQIRCQDSGKRGGLDRLEQEGSAFHERIRHGYLDLARQHKERIVVIDGSLDRDTVHQLVKEHLLRRLERPESSYAL
jgi:dTMP kinase